MAAIQAKEGIYYVGALDKDLRVFDIVMYSEYGTTYNAYLVKGGSKNVLFETVKDKLSPIIPSPTMPVPMRRFSNTRPMPPCWALLRRSPS